MIKDIDLNLLIIFDAVMAERNLRKAGEMLGRSQPSISQSIARLRDITRDQLFKKTPIGVEPTDRAEVLWTEIRDPLAKLRAALIPAEFEPSKMIGEVVIGLSDDARILLWPALAKQILNEAPNVTLRALDTNHLRVWDDLRNGRLDVALTVATQPPPGMGARIVHQDEFVLLHKAGLKAPKTAKSYASLKHLALAFGDEQPAYADEALGAEGMGRRVIARVSRFDALPDLVRELDAVVALPKMLTQHFAARYGLAVSPLPVPFPPAILKLCWNEKSRNDPRLSWFRDCALACVTHQIDNR
jgi:DNA-binding transcriptional LysR family regulator